MLISQHFYHKVCSLKILSPRINTKRINNKRCFNQIFQTKKHIKKKKIP